MNYRNMQKIHKPFRLLSSNSLTWDDTWESVEVLVLSLLLGFPLFLPVNCTNLFDVVPLELSKRDVITTPTAMGCAPSTVLQVLCGRTVTVIEVFSRPRSLKFVYVSRDHAT